MSGPAVIGRDAEFRTACEVLHRARSGPAGLVLAGEPGIGKTTVWRAAVEHARHEGFRVLTARPAEAESGLALVVLADLFTAALTEFGREVPAPQARALRAGLLLDERTGTPDEGALNAGVLSLVRAMVRASPLVLAVDDVQWADQASVRALTFLVRRLSTEPVAVLLTKRGEPGGPLPIGLGDGGAIEVETSALRPLDPEPLSAVLAAHLGTPVAVGARGRLHEISGGNPFFAIELARAAGADGLREAAGPPPAPPTLASVLRSRLDALSPSARELVATVAAIPQPTFAKVRGVAGEDAAALSEALDAGVLLRDGERLRFSHPLLASVAYGELLPAGRRALHERLARSSGDVVERGHHLALATTAPDAGTAALVDAAAEGASRRGALAVAADFYAHARRLTPADDGPAVRRRAAAEASCRSLMGQTEWARRLLVDALKTCDAGRERAHLLYELARSASWGVNWRESADLLHEAEEHCEGDPWLRARIVLYLAVVYTLFGDRPREVIRYAGQAVDLAEELGDDVILGEALANLGRARILAGEDGDADLERALALEPATAHLSPIHRPSDYVVEVHLWRDKLEAATERLERILERCVERGEETAAGWTLWRTGLARCAQGDPQAAQHLADRTRDLALDGGQIVNEAVALALAAHVAAHRGEGDRAEAAAERARSLAAGRGAGAVERLARASLAGLDLAHGRHAAAHERLGPLVEAAREAGIREPGAMRFVPDDVEALVGLGRLDQAADVLAWYADCARSAMRNSALVAAERCRALLVSAEGDSAGAARILTEALARPQDDLPVLDRARAQLTLGIVERRARRKRPAREALEAAVTTFDDAGAARWAQRAREELARIGGRRPAGATLTPTERRVAALVAQGRTNQQVAAELFVSVRSVEANLTRVYAKLELGSRTELAAQRERLGL